jgi:hypothetical protein
MLLHKQAQMFVCIKSRHRYQNQLPSVRLFTKCILSGTRQITNLLSVPKIHLVKVGFAECHKKYNQHRVLSHTVKRTLGKLACLSSVFSCLHSANLLVC